MTRRWIVAMGGGGFMMDDGDPALDAFILELARGVRGRERPRVGWLGTASADSLPLWLRFQAAFAGRAETTHLALFERTVEDIESFVVAQDAWYVGGGNTASLLAVWRAHGVDRALARAHDEGVVLAGLSAGAICWFDAGTTDSYGPTLAPIHGGLGFVPGSCCPHYDGEATRRPTYHRLIADGTLPAGYAMDDDAAVVFDGATLVEAVAGRDGAIARRVERGPDGTVIETPLPMRRLP